MKADYIKQRETLRELETEYRKSLSTTTDMTHYELTATGTPMGLARIESEYLLNLFQAKIQALIGEYSPESGDELMATISKPKRTGPTWAHTPALRQTLIQQQNQDPDTLLGNIPIQPLDLECTFLYVLAPSR